MEDRFAPEVCLIQIATAKQIALIDPFLSLDLDPIWTLVCDEKVETVVHAGQEDLGLCVQHAGLAPRRVFDVQLAAGLCGFDYPLSLQRLVQSTLHIRLHKANTLTDWRKRPLSDPQLRYAAEDVSHLLDVQSELVARLRKLHRLEWAKEECRGLEDISLYRRADEDKLLRVKGAGSLQGRQLAVLRDVLPWRESLAQVRNRPPRTVLRDHLLVEIARLGLSSYAAIRELRGINLGDKDVHALARVVHKALHSPDESWPRREPRDAETPGEDVLLPFLTSVLKGYCAANDLAYGLAATKKDIRDLIRHFVTGEPRQRDRVALLSGWRGNAVGGMMEDLLHGRSFVRVHSNNGEVKLEMVKP